MNASIITFASLSELLNGVTVQKVESLKGPLAGQTLEGALSAFVKGGKSPLAQLGAYAHVYCGIVQTLCHGNKTRLSGLEANVKKVSPEFGALVAMGVVSPAGELLIGVDEAIPKRERASLEKALMGQSLLFCAFLWDARKSAAAAAAAERKLAAADKAAEAEATEATEAPTPGQEQEQATVFILQCIKSGTFNSDLADQLRAALRTEPALI